MYLFFRKALSIFFHIKYKINVINPENIPDLKGGFVIASNHQSYTDPPMIAANIRGKYSFIAKSELFEKKLFGWLITKCGAFPVVRGAGDNGALLRAEEDIKKGKIFVIFPEGTRSKDGKIGRGKSGVTVIASAANAPVLPVCLMYGLGGKKRSVDFAVGKLIPAEEIHLSGEDKTELKRSTNRIMDSIRALQQQIFDYRGIKPESAPEETSEN